MWLGGTSNAIVDLAASVADGWNGWGLSEERFARKVERLRQASTRAGRGVDPTWAGLVLVARDASELEAMLAERRDRGLGIGDLWAGTADDLVAFLRRLRDRGATWAVLMLAGPANRAELIAERVLPELARG